MEFNWIEAIGYAGTGFTILAYGAKDLVPLRIAAILSSLAFLAYGLLAQSYPLVLMEVVLLPINIFRLLELLAVQRQSAAAEVYHREQPQLSAVVGSTYRARRNSPTSRPSTS